MKVVILAGGLGTRIMEESQSRPKPMIEIGDHPILWHIMKLYDFYGLSDFVICLGYKGYMIKDYFINYRSHNSDVTVDLAVDSITYHKTAIEPWQITLVNTGEITQTGGRLKRVSDYLKKNETFCMTYGDGLANLDLAALLAFHRSHGRKATITAVSPPGRFGALSLKGDDVTAFMEKPKAGTGYINGGFFVLEPAVLNYIDNDHTLWEKKPLEKLAHENELKAFVHNGFWHPMDTLRDKKYLDQLWESGHAPWKIWQD